MKIGNHIFSILSSALLLTLWLPATTALASSDFWCKVDSSMSIRYHRPQIDTAYLSRPATKWTFKVKTNTTGAGIKATGESNGTKMETNLNAAAKQTYAVGVAYLGLGASLSINPANLQGKYNDWEFNLSSVSAAGHRNRLYVSIRQNFFRHRQAGRQRATGGRWAGNTANG
jgi:hypothetical protein